MLRGSALEARRGIVRMDPATAAALGLRAWDPVLLSGRHTTAALVGFAAPGQGTDVLHCDDLVLGNLAVTAGTAVTVAPVPASTAATITLTGPAEVTALVDPALLRQALLGKPLTVGDNVSLLPQDLSLPAGTDPAARDAARRSIQSAVGPAWTTLLLTVTSCDPGPGAIVSTTTAVGWHDGPTTAGSTPVAVSRPGVPVTGGLPIADLPGCEGPAAALREMLDVGFHGTELLRRLGASAQLGVLLSGPAGSGTTELVHSVASAVGATVVTVWAPRLAATDPDVAVRSLTGALPPPGSPPSVLPIEDVEALAPRDGRSPLLPTLLQVVSTAAAQDGVAVVATTASPATATVSAEDLTAALAVVRPSALGEAGIDVGDLTLDDVGDMVEVKQALTEAVLWPLNYPDTFTRMGIEPPRGVLLYGPPGCGKTFLVRALAATGQANLLAVKGAEVLSVAALLTELDGVDALRDVVVVAATNRPDLIDPALLRPGRLGRLVYVPPPDAAARRLILGTAARRVPLADEVDLDAVAEHTEGYSAADCAELLRESAMTAMRESMATPTVTPAHVQHALRVVRPSLDPAQVAHLAEFAARQQG